MNEKPTEKPADKRIGDVTILAGGGYIVHRKTSAFRLTQDAADALDGALRYASANYSATLEADRAEIIESCSINPAELRRAACGIMDTSPDHRADYAQAWGFIWYVEGLAAYDAISWVEGGAEG